MKNFQSPLNKLQYNNLDLYSALNIVALAFNRLQIRYAVSGAAALALYAEHYNVVFRDCIKSIEILVYPTAKFTSDVIIATLCANSFFASDFRAVEKFGPREVQVIVRSSRAGKGDVAFDLKVHDHWTSPERRLDYDLSQRGNERAVVRSNGMKLYLINSGWLLREKIRLWETSHRRFEDTNDIVTLCDILQSQEKKLKPRPGNKEDMRNLDRLLNEWGHDWRVLRNAIDCPEVLGPWLEIWWVHIGFQMMSFVLLLLLYDEWTSEGGGEDKSETLLEILGCLGRY